MEALEVEDTSDDSLPMGFPEVGTWNSTHNVSLNDMNLDARMVRIRFRMRNLILMMRAYICVYNLINTTAMPVNQPTTGFISTFIGSMVKGSSGKLINQRDLVIDTHILRLLVTPPPR